MFKLYLGIGFLSYGSWRSQTVKKGINKHVMECIHMVDYNRVVGSKREAIPLNSVFRKEFSQLAFALKSVGHKEPTTREVFPAEK